MLATLRELMAPIATNSMIRWLWLLLGLLVAMTARAGLLDDMVALERVYVPVLALTNQPGKQAACEMYIDMRPAPMQ